MVERLVEAQSHVLVRFQPLVPDFGVIDISVVRCLVLKTSDL